jgi:hypothetical protein
VDEKEVIIYVPCGNQIILGYFLSTKLHNPIYNLNLDSRAQSISLTLAFFVTIFKLHTLRTEEAPSILMEPPVATPSISKRGFS